MSMKRLIRNKRIYLSIVLLLLLYFACPIKLRQVTGTPFDSIAMGYLHRIFGLFFWSLILCLYGVFLNRVSTSPKKEIVLANLSFVFAVLIGGISLYNSLPSVRSQRILAGAQFAPLPESAKEIKVLAWYTPMSGEEYLRFRANPVEIKSFLEQSPVLEHAEYEEYSDKKMRLYFPSDFAARTATYLVDNHEYINNKPTVPVWYMQEIKDIARRYRIEPKGYNSAGELIVDQRTNLIFIKLIIG